MSGLVPTHVTCQTHTFDTVAHLTLSEQLEMDKNQARLEAMLISRTNCDINGNNTI